MPGIPRDIQEDWSLPFIRWVVEHSTAGLECTLQPDDPPGILMGTHRDIVCDPALYNLARVEAGRPTTHIVLGSNLAGLSWVREIMVANKAIFIDRSLAGRAALKQQIDLSGRIAEIVRKGGHVWIAQGPGRAKNGLDETSGSLLRMLALAWGGEELGPAALDGLVRPVVTRYDFNPCDRFLAQEKLTGEKPDGDDERSMIAGLEGWKGKVQIAEGQGLASAEWREKGDWNLMATAMDEAMKALDIRGQWALEAKSALDMGKPDGVSPGFRERMTEIADALRKEGVLASWDAVAMVACEIYREGTSS